MFRAWDLRVGRLGAWGGLWFTAGGCRPLEFWFRAYGLRVGGLNLGLFGFRGGGLGPEGLRVGGLESWGLGLGLKGCSGEFFARGRALLVLSSSAAIVFRMHRI